MIYQELVGKLEEARQDWRWLTGRGVWVYLLHSSESV